MARPQIKTGYVYARGGESLRQLLENQVGIPSYILNGEGYFEKIKTWNPGLEDSSVLVAGERIYVEIPFSVILSPKAKRKIASISDSKLLVKKMEINDDSDDPNRWNYSLFYALSRGFLSESIVNSDISTESTQDSPLTLGFSTFKKIDYDLSYSASLYISKLDGGLSDQNESVSIPWEYGVNSYLGYQKENWPLEVYAGFDHERFSSYNTEELPSGESLSSREHALTYLTVGLSKKFEWFDKQFLAKASYSSSIASSQSRPSKINPKEFEGTKFILYLNMKASKNWFYHGFYKQHDLEGATQLHVARLGLGFGYSF